LVWLQILLAACALAGCATMGGPTVVAVVNGEPLTETDMMSSIRRSHMAEAKQAPPELSVQRLVQQAVDDRLMTQEARRVGIFERADIQEAVRLYLVRESVIRLYRDEVEKKVVVPEKDVKEAFMAGFDEVGLIVLRLADEASANQAAKRLHEGEDPAAVAKDLGLSEPREQLMRRVMVAPELRPLCDMLPGSVLGPVVNAEGRLTVAKLTQRRPVREEDLDKFRKGIEKPMRKEREKERGDAYLAELRAKYPPEVDQAVLGSLSVKIEDLDAVASDQRVVVKAGGKSLTVAQLAAQIKQAAQMRFGAADIEQVKGNIVSAWVDERVIDAEALSRHYELSDAGLAADLAAYQRALALKVYVGQVVSGQAKTDEAAVRAYYQAHLLDYLKPRNLKLRQLTLASQPEAAAASETLKGGADFSWLARQKSHDDEAEKGGQRGWVAEKALSPAAQEALKDLKAGEVTGPVPYGDKWQVFLLESREADEPLPFEEVRTQVQTDYWRAETERVRSEVAARLREGASIEISAKGVASLKERCFPSNK
jgi:parvulin-like peptidyl-prolyl isomerase